jgi:CDP-diacylglycerol--glycerol-3-phosphate 3-phosphatidyltransferase
MTGVFEYWPNRITALRFVGALGLFFVLAQWGEPRADMPPAEYALAMDVAFWLFLAVALSDILDGWLARRGKHITAFGRIADPFVDKVLVLGAMVYLTVLPWSRHLFPAWVVVVILAREFLVTGIRGYVESLGREFPADWFGKIKMLVQCWAVGIPLGLEAFEFSTLAEERWEFVAHGCVIATVATSVGSGFTYVLKARKLLTSPNP